MKHYVSLFLLTFFLFNCSPDDDNDTNNNPPSSFSANTIDTRIDGATIEWTEAIDSDDDAVTYAIILEGQEVAFGGSNLSYSFSGLEPDTGYDGYVEARDGNGGISIANFFFLTDPQVIVFNVSASYWEFSRVPEAGGERVVFGAGFEVPIYEDATLYQIEILDHEIDGSTVNSNIGEIFTWTDDSQSNPVEFVNNTGKYGVVLNNASVNTIGPQFDDIFASISSVGGEAQVTIMIGN